MTVAADNSVDALVAGVAFLIEVVHIPNTRIALLKTSGLPKNAKYNCPRSRIVYDSKHRYARLSPFSNPTGKGRFSSTYPTILVSRYEKCPRNRLYLPVRSHNNPLRANSTFRAASPALNPPRETQMRWPSASSNLSSCAGQAHGQW